MNELSTEEIKTRYLKPPTFEEIYEFIKELGVNGAQFERYYSIPPGIIKLVKHGSRELPVKYWPIIYEKRSPAYIFEYNNKVLDAKQQVTKKVSTTQTGNIGHERLNRLK